MRINIWVPDDEIDGVRSSAHAIKNADGSSGSVSGYFMGLHRANKIKPAVYEHEPFVQKSLEVPESAKQIIDNLKKSGVVKPGTYFNPQPKKGKKP